MDYNKELERLASLLSYKQYATIIKDVAWIFEMALKELYIQQINFFERHKNNSILNKEYKNFLKKERELLPDFDIKRTSFAEIGFLFYKTNFNQLIELRINKPLTFAENIPWREIRETRNTIVHTTHNNVDRNIALRFIDYVQIYLRETRLTETTRVISELKCYSCSELIDREWKFCPNCGVNLSLRCKKCGAELEPQWKICPVCSTPREGLKVKNPTEIFKNYCQAVWSDGFLNKEENDFLKRKQMELGLSDEEAKEVENKYAPQNAIRFRDMIESCMTDNHIDDNEKGHLRKKADDLSLDHKLANSIYLASINSKIGIPLFDE